MNGYFKIVNASNGVEYVPQGVEVPSKSVDGVSVVSGSRCELLGPRLLVAFMGFARIEGSQP
jgi:hypothetical protein